MSEQSNAIGEVVALAGGRIVGKTRLQKSVFVLEQAGVGFDFPFSYHHYGPYSEDVAWAAKDAALDGIIVEREEVAQWGGKYSVFSLGCADKREVNSKEDRVRAQLLTQTAKADAVALELAATAALLKEEGVVDYWGETQRRKPLKATAETITQAKELWRSLRAVKTPEPLPDLG